MNRIRAWGMSLLFLSGTISPILSPQALAQSGSWQMQQMRQQQAMQRQQQIQQQQAMQQRQQQMQQQQAMQRQQQAMQQRVTQRPPQVLPRNAVTMPRPNAAVYPRYAAPPVSSNPSRSIPTTAIRGQPNRNVGSSEGRGFVSSAGIAKLTRPLTPGEIKKGFTGKVLGDGRPLIKFQGRVFAVPAASISGLVKKPSAQSQMVANTNRWNAQQKVGMNARLRALSAQKVAVAAGAAGGRPPTGNYGGPVNNNRGVLMPSGKIVNMGILKSPAIPPTLSQAKLISFSEGLQTTQSSKFRNVEQGSPGNKVNKYLWTIDDRGLNIAKELRGDFTIKHTNISNKAYIGGEVWFEEDTVYLNAGSGRFGDGNSSVSRIDYAKSVQYWEELGYNVKSAPLGTRDIEK